MSEKTNKERKQISKLCCQANWELIIIFGFVIYEIYISVKNTT